MAPLFIPALSLIAGILLDHWFAFDVRPMAWATAALGFIWIVSLWRARRLARAAGCLLLAAAGAARHGHQLSQPVPRIEASSREILLLEGCVVDPPALHSPGDRTRFLLELEPGSIAQVTLYPREDESPPDLRYGERVELEARLRPVRNYGNPGAFDYANYLRRRSIYWNASARVDTRILRKGQCGSRLQAAIFRLRGWIEGRIERLFPGDTYASVMMSAILIGQTEGMERRWTDEFRRTGTYHALVVSGMHFTTLAFAMHLAFRLFSLGPFARLAAGLLLGWTYAALCGWTAPVVRAAGALTVFLTGGWMHRRVSLLQALALVAIAYLLHDPGQLFEASFQLSFAAVLALGALVEPVLGASTGPYENALRQLAKKGRDFRLPPPAAAFRVELRLLAEVLTLWFRVPTEWAQRTLAGTLKPVFLLWDLFAVSFLLQLALLMPMAIYFHRANWTGITANLAVVPLMNIAVPAGFIAVFTGWTWPASAARWCLDASAAVVHWHVALADTPLERRMPDAPAWALAALLAILAAAALSFRFLPRLRWWTLASAAASSFAFALVRFPAAIEPGILEVAVVDVGQGDSIFASFADGQRMLIDGGGILSFSAAATGKDRRRRKPQLDTGEDVVSPYLWTRRLDRVDVIVSTHAHDDHIGGLPALIENFRPRELWTGALPTAPSESWERVEQACRRRGVRIVSRRAPLSFDFGGARIEILAPDAGYVPGPTAKNNDSLVFTIRYGSRGFLLTGDAERQVEARLPVLQPVDVLKVGHHGSRTSTTQPLLDAARPRFALISAGFENQFRHPHPSVVKALEESGARVLRTDVHGLIRIRTNGQWLRVHTGPGPE